MVVSELLPVDYLPLFAALKDRPVLVVGTGEIADRKIAFRCFYSFSVARAPVAEGERALSPETLGIEVTEVEKMPTDKLVDISPMALRMSSPFNAGYWLTAA